MSVFASVCVPKVNRARQGSSLLVGWFVGWVASWLTRGFLQSQPRRRTATVRMSGPGPGLNPALGYTP